MPNSISDSHHHALLLTAAQITRKIGLVIRVVCGILIRCVESCLRRLAVRGVSSSKAVDHSLSMMSLWIASSASGMGVGCV